MFFVMCFCLTSCSSKGENLVNISEKDELLYCQEDDNFFVTLCIGKRENPYVVDGQSSDLIDFAVLTAIKKNVNISANDANYKITVDGREMTGKFEVNPFDGSFVVDLLNVGDNPALINVEIKLGGKSYSYELTSALDEQAITADEALSLAWGELKKCENDITQNGSLRFEIYVRLMKNSGQIPLYYVSAINQQDQVFALIIDPNTKQVIAKNFK